MDPHQQHTERIDKLARDHKRMSLIYGIGIVLVSVMAMYMFNVSWMHPSPSYSTMPFGLRTTTANPPALTAPEAPTASSTHQ